MRLTQAWSCWCQSFPNYSYGQDDIIEIVTNKPCCKIKPILLPKIRNKLKLILTLMEQSPLLRTSDGDVMDMDLESSFTCGLEYVKETIDYIFANRN